MPNYYLCCDDDEVRAQLPERVVNLPPNLHAGDWLQFKNSAGAPLMGLIKEIKHFFDNSSRPMLMFIDSIALIPVVFQDMVNSVGVACSVQLKLQDAQTNAIFQILEIRPEDFQIKKNDTFYAQDGNEYQVDELIYASYYNAGGCHHAIARVKPIIRRISQPVVNQEALLLPIPDDGYSSNRASPAASDFVPHHQLYAGRQGLPMNDERPAANQEHNGFYSIR